MTLDHDHIDHVLRALTGKLLGRKALGDLVKRLESQEEFMAWLLVTEAALAGEPELAGQVRALARAQQVAPATRRASSDYPLALEESRHKLRADITALLDAHCSPGSEEDSLHADRVHFAQAAPVGQAPMRDLLAIRPRPAQG